MRIGERAAELMSGWLARCGAGGLRGRCARAAALVLLLTASAGVATLMAHLAVVKTSPARDATLSASPPVVRVWFNQQPAARISRLELTGPAGEIALGDLEIDAKERSIAAPVRAPLPPGRYEVAWRTAGDDGHVLRGTFRFTLTPAE